MRPSSPYAKAATSGAAKQATKPPRPRTPRLRGPAGLTAAPPTARRRRRALKRAISPSIPRLIVAGSSYCSSLTGNCNDGQEPAAEYAHSYPRAYVIHGHGHARYPAYYMTMALNPLLGEYYGVQGTTWQNPPLLASPSATKFVDGKKLELFAAGGRLMTVAWKTRTAPTGSRTRLPGRSRITRWWRSQRP